MLFVTTTKYENPLSFLDAMRVAQEENGTVIPYQINPFSADEMNSLAQKSQNELLAYMYNLFFSCELTEWDVRLCTGLSPARLRSTPHRVHFCELWNNPKLSMDFAVESIQKWINLPENECAFSWCKIVFITTILFDVYFSLNKREILEEDAKLDVSLSATDFSAVMACCYAKEMGLPIGKIICGCNENGGLWDLIRYGQFRTSLQAVQTDLPLCDTTIPCYLINFLESVLGYQEATRFQKCCDSKKQYILEEDQMIAVSEVMSASVIGKSRLNDLIHTMYSNDLYLVSPYTAQAYAALQDYRSKGKNVNDAIVLCERCAADDVVYLSNALKMLPTEILEIAAKN